mgnify:CR=1 FL=1
MEACVRLANAFGERVVDVVVRELGRDALELARRQHLLDEEPRRIDVRCIRQQADEGDDARAQIGREPLETVRARVVAARARAPPAAACART